MLPPRVYEIGTGNYNVPPRGYGGTERIIFRISMGLSKLGIEPCIVDFGDASQRATLEVSPQQGIRRLVVKPLLRINTGMNSVLYHANSFLFGLTFAFLIAKGNIPSGQTDVIHVHVPSHAVIAKVMLKFRRLDAKIVYSVHEPHLANLSPLSKPSRAVLRLVAFVGCKAASIVTFENLIAKRSSIALPGTCVLVLPNCIDPDEFSTFNELCNPNDLLMVGRISKVKEQVEALLLFSMLAATNVDMRLTFIGKIDDRAYYAKLKGLITSLNLEARVRHITQLSRLDLGRLYSASGLHLVLSDTAGTDVVVPESLAMGRILVVKKIPAVECMLKDMKDAITIDTRNIADAVSRIRTVLNNEELSSRITANARLVARQVYDYRVVAAMLAEQLEFTNGAEDGLQPDMRNR